MKAGLKVKADTYVLETNIHYPTDVSLLYDSARKCLDMVKHLLKHVELEGWRKRKDWERRFRNQSRYVHKVAAHGGPNKALRLSYAVHEYIRLTEVFSAKIQQSLTALESCGTPLSLALEIDLKHYRNYLLKFSDQIHRRLILGEKIPHDEKVFSIFEPHTEWINKGKRHPEVELGHPVLVATDQFQFILHHQVVEKQADVALALPLVKSIKKKYQRPIYSMSFDRGFFSYPNKEAISKEVEHLCLPKKGKRNAAEEVEETHKSFIKLRHQHSAIEAHINQLEHHGLNKCPDKGLHGFKRYTALGVLAYNLHRLGNHLVKEAKAAQKQGKKAA